MTTADAPFASLAGQRVCVTGSSSGIGRAISLELARAGGDVAVHYAHRRELAEETAALIRALGRQAHIMQCDLRNPAAKQLVSQVWEQFGPIDVWVNNAGADILTGNGPQLETSDKLDLLWQVDVRACFELSREVGERMRNRGAGVILNIGWDQADRGMGGESAELFATVKNAVMGFTRSLAVTLAPHVRVNCIAPGWIRTDWGSTASAAWQARVLSETPLKRWGEPADIANLARFLCSPAASYITGQVINANGGAIR